MRLDCGDGCAGRRHIPKPGEEKDHREEAKERIRKEAAARLGTFQVLNPTHYPLIPNP